MVAGDHHHKGTTGMRGSRRLGSSGGGGESRSPVVGAVPALTVHGGSVYGGGGAGGTPPVSPLNKLRPLGSPYRSPGGGGSARLSPLGRQHLSPVSPSPRGRASRYSDSNDPLLQDVDELLSPSTTPRQVISAPSALNPVVTPVNRGMRGVFASHLPVVGSPQAAARMQVVGEGGDLPTGAAEVEGSDEEAGWRAQRRLRRPLSEDFGSLNLRQYSGMAVGRAPFTKDQSVDPDEWGFAEGSSNSIKGRAAAAGGARRGRQQQGDNDAPPQEWGRRRGQEVEAPTSSHQRPPLGAGRGRRDRGEDKGGEKDTRFVETRRDPSPNLHLNERERKYLEPHGGEWGDKGDGGAESGGSFGNNLGRRKAKVIPPSLDIHAQPASGREAGGKGRERRPESQGDKSEMGGSGSSTGVSPRDDASPMSSPSKGQAARGHGPHQQGEGVTTPRVAVEDDPLLVTTRDAILATSGDNSPVKVGSVAWTRGELLGEGAYGKVYTGLNQRNGQLMAVKQLKINPNDQDQAKYVKMLEREVGICKRMRHQHIVGYLGTERDSLKNELYVFLEYVPGGSIQSMLKNFGAFSEELVRIYTRQILLGLDYLHAHKVVHRDIKGANILVDNHGVVKLADFGSSQSFGKVAKQSNGMSNGFRSIAGSIYWMAPEVMRETGYGRRADIWSVGCTVVEMLSGQRPWPDLKDPWSSIFRIAESKEGPPLPEGISNLARDFLKLCFQRDIKKRPRASQLLNHRFVNPPNMGRPTDAVQKSL